MSKTTSILANHNLDTSSLDNLAKDVSNRLKATIQYGYQNIFDYNKYKNNEEPNYQNIILGATAFAKSKKKYTLLDNHFQYKEFIKKQGLKELENPIFKTDEYLKKELFNAKNAIEFELTEEDNLIMVIYRDTLDLWMVDSLDWHGFQRTFLYKIDEDTIVYLNNWRKESREVIYKLGGHEMFVFCIEDDSYFLIDEAIFKSGNVLKKIVTKKLKSQLVNIPNYIKSGLYKNKHEYAAPILDGDFFEKMNEILKENPDYKPVKINYPCIFYDDFHDLKGSKPISLKAFDILYDGSKVLEQIKISII